MKVVYTENPKKERDTVYRDPKMFYGVITKATEVIVEGDYPTIIEAYKDVGIEVKHSEPSSNSTDLTKLSVDELKKRLADAGIEFDKSAKKDELIKLIQSSEGA